MTKKMTLASLLLVIGLSLFAAQCSKQTGESGEVAEIGSRAPSFELSDLNGQSVSLSQFKGKVVMLDFWATWCGPCRMTMPLLEKLQQEHAGEFVLLAVNLGDPRDAVVPYVQQQHIQARVLLDTNVEVGQAYGSSAIPMQVLIDKDGIIRHVQRGYYPSMKEDLWAEIAKLR